ncbi:hypothetical protein L3Q82_007042 [Scortum barcoo]|uniref:Uncharacterized protein n=1 Tax=Scortum barcoo TaxID=214431 RepID=A0ACB8WXD3_9TELE|nr:hypothetical protein L3Q82_007042 [Scortum barcoo]
MTGSSRFWWCIGVQRYRTLTDQSTDTSNMSDCDPAPVEEPPGPGPGPGWPPLAEKALSEAFARLRYRDTSLLIWQQQQQELQAAPPSTYLSRSQSAWYSSFGNQAVLVRDKRGLENSRGQGSQPAVLEETGEEESLHGGDTQVFREDEFDMSPFFFFSRCQVVDFFFFSSISLQSSRKKKTQNKNKKTLGAKKQSVSEEEEVPVEELSSEEEEELPLKRLAPPPEAPPPAAFSAERQTGARETSRQTGERERQERERQADRHKRETGMCGSEQSEETLNFFMVFSCKWFGSTLRRRCHNVDELCFCVSKR